MGHEEMKSNVLKAESSFLQYFKGADTESVQSVAFQNKTFENSSELENRMLETSKMLKLLNLNLKATEFQLRSTIAKGKPNLSLSASTTAPAKNFEEDLVANVGFLLNYTFNDGGKNDAEIRSFQLKLKALEIKKTENIMEMKTSLALLVQEQKASKLKLKSLDELVELAKEVRDTAKAQLVSGRSKIEDVMNAEVALAETKIDLIIEANLKPWDYMAQIPLIRELGGNITDWEGKDLNVKSKGKIIASMSMNHHKKIINFLK